MSGPDAWLYRGIVTHVRARPRRHTLRKRIPMVLVDLQALPALEARLGLFGVDRPAPVSLRARHHLAGDATPLAFQVRRHLTEAGLAADGAIRLLCMPAVLGAVFNPLSVYFCHHADGRLAAVLYEVNNTFGQRHVYVLPADGDAPRSPVVQTCRKTFHVSPFMDMDLAYRFRIEPPGEQVSIAIGVEDAQGMLLSAAFRGRAEPLTDRALLGVIVRHPFLMLEVLAAIHWEAVKLLAKGLRLRPGPPRGPDPKPRRAPAP